MRLGAGVAVDFVGLDFLQDINGLLGNSGQESLVAQNTISVKILLV